MAKRKTRRATTSVVRVAPTRAAAPIINVRAPSAPAKRKGGRRRASSRSHSRGSGVNALVQTGMGGFGFGFIEKQFPNLPTLPVVGRAGTIALLAHYAGSKFPFAHQIAHAAAAIAGYQLGSQGKINGEGEGWDDPIAHQVRGIAAQV